MSGRCRNQSTKRPSSCVHSLRLSAFSPSLQLSPDLFAPLDSPFIRGFVALAAYSELGSGHELVFSDLNKPLLSLTLEHVLHFFP